MSFNLLKTTRELFNNEMVTKASSLLGEPFANTQKAIEGGIAAVVGAVAEKNASGGGVSALLNAIKEGGLNHDYLQKFSNAFDKPDSPALQQGQALATNLLGDKFKKITDTVSNFSGVSSASSASILGIISSLVLASAGRHQSTGNLSNEAFSSDLNHQKNLLPNFIPTGFENHFENLGFGNFQKTTTPQAQTSVNYPAPPAASKSKWLLPLILGALVLAALWYFLTMKGCSSQDATNVIDSTVHNVAAATDSVASGVKGVVDSLTGDFIYNSGKIIPITLPNGTILNVGEYSTEARLVAFLSDKNAAIDTINGNWFEFTNVRFKSGGSELSDSSDMQLKNFVEIAKAFPAAQFKIGGYTDSTGIPARNLTLSSERANTVYKAVVMFGASKSSLTGAKGFGSEYPIGDNTTVEGRAMNRRVAINVKAK